MGYADRDYYREARTRAPSRLGNAPVVKWLLIVNIAVFFIDILFEAGMKEWCEYSVSGLLQHYHVWGPLTFQFFHADLGHLVMNMFGLYLFGSFVEQQMRSRSFLVFYLLCGIAGAGGYTALVFSGYYDPGMVGASAGVFGILVLAAFLGKTTHMHMLFMRGTVTMRQIAVIFLVINLIFLLTAKDNYGGHAAHVGGALAALILYKVPFLWRMLERIGNAPRRSRAKARRLAPSEAPKKRRYEKKLRPKSRVSTADASEVDRILDKINEEGLQSLTEEERLLLTRAGKE